MHDNQAPVKTGLLKFLRESVGGQFVIPVYQRIIRGLPIKKLNNTSRT